MTFSNKLIYWYLLNDRDLPWRKTRNPYFIWLSEIMLQQTRVQQGLSYYLVFTKEFPTVFDLANAPESKVLKLWQGLGYYSRARNLHATAQYIASELNGIFPSNYLDLLKLKGIGDYTASAIASICFKQPEAVVDGNVYRVLARYFGKQTPINSSLGIKEFKTLAQRLIDPKQPGEYNQAIMDFGALHCKPQNPLCESCPIQDSCVAFATNTIKELPVKEKKTKVTKRYFNYLVLLTKENQTILTKRNGKGIWEGLYEFPLLETSKAVNESELSCSDAFKVLVPEGAKISLYNKAAKVHKLSHQHLHTKFWLVEVNNHETATIPWDTLQKYPVPVLIANFLEEFDTLNRYF